MEKIMDLESFKNSIREDVQKMLPDRTVGMKMIEKPGSLGYEAIFISPRPGENITAPINIEALYQEYQTDPEGYDRIVQGCAKVLAVSAPKINVDDLLKSYERVKSHLDIRLTKEGPAKSQDFVTRRLFDFLICYVIRITDNEGQYAAYITKDMLKTWGVDENTLIRDAMENLRREEDWLVMPAQYVMLRMLSEDPDMEMRKMVMSFPRAGQIVMSAKLISQMGLEDQLKELGPAMKLAINSASNPMVMLSTRKMFHGAKILFRYDILDRVCDALGTEKAVVLPSSVHELLLVPWGQSVWQDIGYDIASQAVQEVNGSVATVDRLSDQAYLYEKGNGLSAL